MPAPTRSNPRYDKRAPFTPITLRRPHSLLWLLLPTLLSAQEVLNNVGEPLRVSYKCAEDELQAAGLVCTPEEPCAIYLELNALAATGSKLFIAGDLHTTTGTLASIFLASDDNGSTWKEPAPRVAGSSFEQIQFFDAGHGWAAGETQYPLPRDPFFLVSTDGGVTWRPKPVSEDGGPGSIQRFWFDSADHGELIVDAGKTAPGGRYTSYESETGGASWMFRSSTAQMPKIKRAPTAFENPDFRMAPTSSGKAVQIERRSGDKWLPVASFLIEVASCKIKPGELKEPPPEAATPAETGPPELKDYVEEIHLGGSPVKKATPKSK